MLWIVARSLTVEGFRDLPGGAESLRHITVRLLAGWRGSVVGVTAGREMIDTATARAGFVRRPIKIKSVCIGQFEKT